VWRKGIPNENRENRLAITLREVTKDDWTACIKLQVSDDQRGFVASNLYSLAESKFYSWLVPQGIYHDDTMVGFTMWGLNPDDTPGEYWIMRLMVDQQYQKRGYGCAAMKILLEQLRAAPGCTAILLSFEPHNRVAQALYEKLGFRLTGEIFDGEAVMRLDLKT
jgi:diamine N-acetyltransferase